MKGKNILQLLWLHYMRSYLRLALFFYYKKIELNFKVPLQKNQPRLILGNHQNGLMDPLIIAAKSGQFSYCLTRASVFKKPWIERFLKSLLMIPIYRMRDGWKQISKNGAVFKTCSNLLHEHHAIVLFPEGNQNIKRSVRPLSKGFTRIVEETIHHYPEVNVEMVPVGFNYKSAQDFADSVVLNFGCPLASRDYQHLDENVFAKQLKIDVYKALTTLTTHIDTDDYDNILMALKRQKVNFLCPEEVNHCIATNFKDCKSHPEKTVKFIKSIAKVGLIIGLCVPYAIWKFIVEPKVKEPEFTATFRFAIVISLVPIFMLAMALILGLNFGIFYALFYLISVLALDILAVKL